MEDLRAALQAALGERVRIERELGGGGMSRVFVALEVALGRRVVVKVLPPELAAAVSVERFRREIQLAASLHHPHIVPLLTAGEAPDLLYYTMPYIEGETLRARLAREGPLPVADATRLAREVADALAYAHRRGVVHRDIKPENVLLSEGHAVVADFGVAKALTQATGGRVTGAGIALGTPLYMAPEQAAADPEADHRTDLYALGVLAYEMLGGRPPFQGESPQQILAAQVTAAPPPIDRIRRDLPPRLSAAIMRCLAKDPAARWQSAGAFRSELEALPTPGALSARMRPHRGRRAALIALGVLALAAAAVLGARRHRAAVATSPSLVAVLPFAVRGPGDAAWLGQGMVDLLSTGLDGAGELRTVDPRAVLSMAHRVSALALDPLSGAVAAGRLGAGRFVLGDVVAAGTHLQLEATLYDGAHPDIAEASATVQGDAAQLFALVDQMATRLLSGAGGEAAGRVPRIAAVTTSSLPALKAYLDGEAALRAGRADSAVTAFQRAVALDSGFALAWYRLSVAAEWATRAELAAQAAAAAVRHGARLSQHARALLEALLSSRRGDAADAEQQFRSILGTHPDDVEAWIQLAEVQFHYGPLEGRPLAAARPAWERVLYLDPTYAGTLVHLARIAAWQHRGAAVDSLVGRILTLNPESERDLEMRALRAWSDGDAAAERAVSRALRQAPDETVLLAAWDVAVDVGDAAAAESVAALLTVPPRASAVQALGEADIACLEMARGRPAEARAAIARAARADSVTGLEFGTLLDLAPFLKPSAAALGRDRWALRHEVPAAVPASGSPSVFVRVHDALHGVLRDYLLGLVSATLGDADAAQGYAAALDAAPPPAAAPRLARDLALEVRAQAALQAGDSAQALALLRQRAPTAWYEYDAASPFVSEARARFLEAWLATRAPGAADSAGARLPAAAGLLATFEGASAYDLVFAAPARFRRAALEARAGDSAAAVRDYRWFLARWKDADPPLAPMLDRARAGLAALGAAAGR